MRRFRRRGWTVWLALGAAVAVAATALAFISVELVRLERAEAVARRDALHAEAVRVALWRMDSRLAPMLATEAARQPFHFLPEYVATAPFAHLIGPPAGAAARIPSPLRDLDDTIVRMHVHVYTDAEGRRRAVSPQAPNGVDDPLRPEAAARLRQVAAELSATPLESMIAFMLSCQEAIVAGADTAREQATRGVDTAPTDAIPEVRDARGDKIDLSRRMATANSAQMSRGSVQTWASGTQRDEMHEPTLVEVPGQWQAEADLRSDPRTGSQTGLESGVDQVIEVGPFVPIWIDVGIAVGSEVGIGAKSSNPGRSLYYLRTISVTEGTGAARTVTQGFKVDWPALRDILLDETSDLVPGADLEPVTDPGLGANGPALATVPAHLVAPSPPLAAAVTAPARTMIALAWGALCLAAFAGAVTVAVVRNDANRRAQFAGTVTHELRTPLTTFRLYADLLADDMVAPARRAELLRTLSDEAERLSGTVEHVLAAARIEAGREPLRVESIAVEELVRRLEATVRRRIERVGGDAEVEIPVEVVGVDSAATCRVDTSAVERIVVNLIDNALRYAPGAPISMRVSRRGGRIEIAVIDRGPGVPMDLRRRLFRAFERGHDDASQAHRGIGLGLALSRDLARAMGGDLLHEPTPDRGATFRLRLA